MIFSRDQVKADAKSIQKSTQLACEIADELIQGAQGEVILDEPLEAGLTRLSSVNTGYELHAKGTDLRSDPKVTSLSSILSDQLSGFSFSIYTLEGPLMTFLCCFWLLIISALTAAGRPEYVNLIFQVHHTLLALLIWRIINEKAWKGKPLLRIWVISMILNSIFVWVGTLDPIRYGESYVRITYHGLHAIVQNCFNIYIPCYYFLSSYQYWPYAKRKDIFTLIFLFIMLSNVVVTVFGEIDEFLFGVATALQLAFGVPLVIVVLKAPRMMFRKQWAIHFTTVAFTVGAPKLAYQLMFAIRSTTKSSVIQFAVLKSICHLLLVLVNLLHNRMEFALVEALQISFFALQMFQVSEIIKWTITDKGI